MSTASQLRTQIKFKIEIISGPHSGLIYSFNKETVTIGRGPENDIVLTNDSRASRQHAEIKINGSDHYVLNLSQKNFVMVNGQRTQSERLQTNSLIQIGESELKFTDERPGAHSSPALSIVPNSSSAPVDLPSFGSVDLPMNFPPPASPMASAPPGPIASYPGSVQLGRGGAPNGRSVSLARKDDGILSDPKVRFYIIVFVLGLFGWFVFSSGSKKALRDANAIRTSDQVNVDLQNADKVIEQLQKRKKQMNEVQYSRAQENFIKGFRDFQQGQYARARESFQVTLNLDPDNELAKRYLQISKVKFDESVKFSMIQGSRYREKKSWRMCQSSFFNVMTMLQNRKDDQTYLEAKRYYDECKLNIEGRY